jgi:uncharacterized membrane protein (UPF0127 family)
MNTNFPKTGGGNCRSLPFGALRIPAWLFCGLLGLMWLSACGGSEAAKSVVPKTVEDRFPIKIGERLVQMQIAVLPSETQKGLMYRQSMGADEGMLFVFSQPQKMGFYMRNTTLPLDIGYCEASGELKEIYPMYPLDERSVSSRSNRIQFCLEMNQGWYKSNGVKPGAMLDLSAVAAALKARGFKPEVFGLR